MAAGLIFSGPHGSAGDDFGMISFLKKMIVSDIRWWCLSGGLPGV